MEEFNDYVQKKTLAGNMKHVRRVMLEVLADNVSPTRIPTNLVKAVTLLMVQQGVKGNIIEEKVDSMAQMEMNFEYFADKYKWFLVWYGIIFFLVGVMAGYKLRVIYSQIEEFVAWMERRTMAALREADEWLFRRPTQRGGMSEEDNNIMMEAMRERHENDTSSSERSSRHHYIDDWDPFSGTMREYRILEKDEDAFSHETYFKYDVVTHGYRRCYKGSHEGSSSSRDMDIDHEGGESEAGQPSSSADPARHSAEPEEEEVLHLPPMSEEFETVDTCLQYLPRKEVERIQKI